jgi:hypothetical protein
MVVEKLAVDCLPAPEPVLDVMPETDAGFAETPAQIDFAVLVKSREIDQPGIRILDLDAHLGDLLDDRFQRSRCRVLAGTRSQYLLAGQSYAAEEGDAMFDRIEFCRARVVLLLRLDHAPHQALNFGQEFFGLRQAKKTWHSYERPEYSKYRLF